MPPGTVAFCIHIADRPPSTGADRPWPRALAFSAARPKTVYHVEMPQPLRHTSARVLEFDALRPMLAGYAWSPLGKTRVERLQPTADRAWIERQQQLAAEVRRFLRSGGHFDFSGLTDPGVLVEKSPPSMMGMFPRYARSLPPRRPA